MQRITQLFEKYKAYIGYLTAGDGGLDYSLEAYCGLIEGGVNMLEIGIPFSDPVADGPVIQSAMQRALVKDIDINDALYLTQRLRKISNIPCILFSYFNPILQYPSFYQDASSAGADGILIVDLPIEEAHYHQQQCLAYNLVPIYLITPSTSLERIKKISRLGRGFFYYVCRKGTTGVRNGLPEDLATTIQTIKKITDIPVVVGFGVSDKKSTEEICAIADGVVVGSYFVSLCEQGLSREQIKNAAKSISPLIV